MKFNKTHQTLISFLLLSVLDGQEVKSPSIELLNKEIKDLKLKVAARCPKELFKLGSSKAPRKRSVPDVKYLLELELAMISKSHLEFLWSKCLALTTLTPSTTIMETTTEFPFPWKLPFNDSLTFADTAFEILRMAEKDVGNRTLLFIKVRVPTDGISRTDNWCHDYKNLCGNLGRKPIGCHLGYHSGFDISETVKACMVYNLDETIAELDCSPNWKIAEYALEAFPDVKIYSMYRYAMGFWECGTNMTENCHKTIDKNYYSLTGLGNAKFNNYFIYTVCA